MWHWYLRGERINGGRVWRVERHSIPTELNFSFSPLIFIMRSKYSGSAMAQPSSIFTSTPSSRSPSSIHENIQPISHPTRPFLPDTSKIIIEDPELPHFRSLENFTSEKEVLIALRDSIIGR